MVTCPNCQIGFSPSYSVCPSCRQFEVPFSDSVRYLATQAESRLEAGDCPQDVERMLIDNGLSEDTTKQLIAMCCRKVNRQTRYHGFWRLFIGLGILSIGLLALGASLVAANLPNRHVVVEVLVVGGAAVIFGCVAVISGLWSILIARDSGLSTPEALDAILFGNKL